MSLAGMIPVRDRHRFLCRARPIYYLLYHPNLCPDIISFHGAKLNLLFIGTQGSVGTVVRPSDLLDTIPIPDM